MADITNSQEHQESPSSKKDIQDLKEDLQTFFKTSMAELLTPVQAKLDELTEGLGAAGRAAASALDTAESLQTEVMTLKRSEALLQTKISTLENRWRQFNLKFRGIEEGTEQDLSLESLEKRRLLKPFSSKLLEAKIRFRWSMTSNITVYKDGVLFQASDLKMGLLLLKNLNVVMTQEETEALQGHPAFEEVQPSGE
ncbi:UNVERIFIED_CONTAM: hypothetical protein K2H54_061004 [Gekko kuhli]